MIVNGGDSSSNLYIPPPSNYGNDVGAFIHTTKAKWVCHGNHPCKDCHNMHGIVKTMAEWMSSGFMPGWHKHCQCGLVAVDEPVSSNHEVPIIDEYHRGATTIPGPWSQPAPSAEPQDPVDDTWHFLDD